MSKEILEYNALDEITVKDFLLKIKSWVNYFKTKWKICLIFCVIGLACGFFYAWIKKPFYIATVSFVLEDEKSSSSGDLSGLANQFGLNIGGVAAGGMFSRNNLIELMKSRTLIQKTLLSSVRVNEKDVSFADFYAEFSGMKEGVRGKKSKNKIVFPPNSNPDSFSLEQNKILGSISETIASNLLSVSEKDKKSSIIYLDVVSENELFSKSFAEELLKNVTEFYVDTKSKKAKINLSILERQTDSIRRELSLSISGVAIANDNTYNLNPAFNINRVPSSKKQIDVQANTAILIQLVQNVEAAKVSMRKETPLIQVIDRPILPLKKGGLGKLKGMIFGAVISLFIVFIYLGFKRVIVNAFKAV